MALSKDFPISPHAIAEPQTRWFPGDEQMRTSGYEKLVPPLVVKLRQAVHEWRNTGYQGACETSHALLTWWFNTHHPMPQADGTTVDFQYYFAQREALETIIYLHDVKQAKDCYDLMRFDSSGAVSAGMFDESWLRLVTKMATGSGKTKVMSLVLAWCYYHKLYEPNSDLAQNFLLITPNIIVLDRIRADFDGLRIFFDDPVLPENGFMGRNWRDHFQPRLHIQDDLRTISSTGNIFLTNIHRVYMGQDTEPASTDENTMDYFLGTRPTGKTTDPKVDLGEIVRDIDELVVINDEAHHIHNPKMAWFQSIQDIHNRLVHKGKQLSLQIDLTATPKHDKGAIFVQTITDYPLVEAIYHNVVKHPVVPDTTSRNKLHERQSSQYTEKYADFLDLGIEEWRKADKIHKKMNKKAILFVMTDDTKNCDEVARYLQGKCPELQGKVLTIHTKNNGDIAETASGKKAEELQELRKQANNIDSWDSPYQAIVSVLMLKEGWDVKNVTTIVGLRAYAAKSNILPEQTLGRGLRKMYTGNTVAEQVSVVGTQAFMDFIESIQYQGVVLERTSMGTEGETTDPLVIEVDKENTSKNLSALDIAMPILTPRAYREYKNLESLSLDDLRYTPIDYKEYSQQEQREIVFYDITSEQETHRTKLGSVDVLPYQHVIGHFVQEILHQLRLFSGYNIIYGLVKTFVAECLFTRVVSLSSVSTLQNLGELAAQRTIIETFVSAINHVMVQDAGKGGIREYKKLSSMRPFVTHRKQESFEPQKSIFNKIIGDSQLELDFANFLEGCDDIISYAKNYLAINFKLDYVHDGVIANYYPDFLVKKSATEIYIVETKGLETVDVKPKLLRLRQWCEDINALATDVRYDFVYIDQKGFAAYKASSFEEIVRGFREYKNANLADNSITT